MTDTCVLHISELSSTLMEKMQAQEMMSGLRIPEMDELGHFFRSLPTSTLVGIGTLTAMLAYWFATRPRPIKPPCSLQHQSEEVPVRCNTHTQSYKSSKTAKGIQGFVSDIQACTASQTRPAS